MQNANDVIRVGLENRDARMTAGNGFFDRIDILAKAVEEQEGARLPGSKRVLPDSVELEEAVWELTLKLARGPA